MTKSTDAHLLRLREAFVDAFEYGDSSWQDAQIGQTTNNKGQKVWRLTIVNAQGQPETFDFEDEDFQHNHRIRDRMLKGRAGPTTSNPRADDPKALSDDARSSNRGRQD
jgi:hypothetical protein